MTNGSTITTTDYLGGFQYNNNLLEFFPHPEGYVKVTATNTDINNPGYTFNYVYNYTDHLGNVRLSYAKDPQTGNLKILDESHYYPFGLKHSEYAKQGFVHVSYLGVVIAPVEDNPYKYKYNGKEWQDELGLNFYDYGARNYDPALGRWNVIDPMAPKYFSHSPYAYALNNPVYFIDPDGMQVSNGDDEVFNEKRPIVLETAQLGGSKRTVTRPNPLGLAILSHFYNSFARNSTPNFWDGAYRNMLSDENRDGYIKMELAKREGEWFTVGLFGVILAPEVALYGSLIVETSAGYHLVQALAKTGIDATAQYAITGDVNWLNAAAGSVLPGKAGTALSPLLSEGSDVLQNKIVENKPFDFQKSSAKVIGGYLGNLSGIGTKAVSSDWGSPVGSFIFSNGVQSFHTQANSEIINSKFD